VNVFPKITLELCFGCTPGKSLRVLPNKLDILGMLADLLHGYEFNTQGSLENRLFPCVLVCILLTTINSDGTIGLICSLLGLPATASGQPLFMGDVPHFCRVNKDRRVNLFLELGRCRQRRKRPSSKFPLDFFNLFQFSRVTTITTYL
jgi:hypothetical protein